MFATVSVFFSLIHTIFLWNVHSGWFQLSAVPREMSAPLNKGKVVKESN